MSTYRGRVVYYGSKHFSHHDPGRVDSLGDRYWTDYGGKGPVQVYQYGKPVGPKFECLYTNIDGYRFTFSSYIGGQQILLLGDFVFVHSSPIDNYYHSSEYTFLVATTDDLTAENMVTLDDDRVLEGMYKVKANLSHKLIGEGDVVKQKDHISPFTTRVPRDDGDGNALAIKLLADNPNLCTCGGAVRLKFQGMKNYRWLFPHPEGVQAAVNHLQNTTLEDDWLALMEIIDDVDSIEKARILETFGK